MCHRSTHKSSLGVDMIANEIRRGKAVENAARPTGRPIKSSVPSSMKTRRRHRRVATLVILASLIYCAGAYDFPIHQNLPNQIKFRSHQQFQAQQPAAQHLSAFGDSQRIQPVEQQASRRSDESSQLMNSGDDASGEEADAQLRQLHQVVDSVAQLLNEEEQRQNGPNRNHRQQQQHADAIQRSMAFQAPELMSESAIRQAIEELEKVQQQERQNIASSAAPSSSSSAAESRHRLSILSPGASSDGRKQATIESLIDEIGGELMDDQLAAASQEAERLSSQPDGAQQRVDTTKREASQSRADFSSSTMAPVDSRSQPVNHSATPTHPSVLAGQLDSIDAELGSALANDFFAFHADPITSKKAQSSAQVIPASPISHDFELQSDQNLMAAKQKDATSNVASNDLEAAAQTRNIITQQRGPQSQQPAPFNRNPGNNLRFDFIQPSAPLPGRPFTLNIETQQQRPQQPSDPDSLVRAFRQQTGAAGDDVNQQFPSSTLLPIPNADNFWRPTGAQPGRQDGDDLSSQYNRVHFDSGLPPLPASRFQSLNSATLRPTGQHIHFTGHSFDSSGDYQAQQPQQQPPPPQQSNNRQSFSSTAPPMISVLSGVDTSGSNSVSWNPPPTAQSPPSQLFSQPFPASTQPSLSQPSSTPTSANGGNNDALISNQFFPSSNPVQPSPLFRNSFQNQAERNSNLLNQDSRPQSQFNQNNFVSSTEPNNVGFTTENRFNSPSTTPSTTTSSTQWTPPSSQSPAERDVSDSQPRSSVRALPNGQRFFSPSDLTGPSSTPSSLSEVSRTSNRENSYPEPTTTSITPTSSSGQNTPLPGAPTNGTGKKEDMVIYYYYYYDDNKNATVVAKNVTTGAPLNPIPLDAAIEADGGVEDTPYMEDPAPVNSVRSSSARPQSFTTPSTTTSTTSTTIATPSLSPFNTFEGTNNDDRRTRGQLGPRGNTLKSELTSSPKIDRNVSPNFGPKIDQNPSSTSSPTRASTLGRLQSSNDQNRVSFSDQNSNSRLLSTEPTVSRTRGESPFEPHSPTPTVPNSRLQSQLIQNVLNGAAAAQSRNQQSFSTPSTPASTTPTGPRTPLSNASRYGTTNNLSIEPYGLDPSAPANFAHSDSTSHHNQRNWPHSQRKPIQAAELPQPSPVNDVSRTSSPSRAQSSPQQFVSQRNQNSAQRNSQVTSTQAGSRLSGLQQNQQANPSTVRQIFPESNQNLPDNDQPSRTPSSAPARQNFADKPKNQLPKPNPNAINNEVTRFSSDNNINDLAATLDDQPDVPRGTAQRNNGRPSIPETGSTSGFARVSTSSTVSLPASTTTQRTPPVSPGSERPTTSSPVGLRPTVSTSVSRSFTAPQQVLVTTSVSPPTVVSNSITPTTTQSMQTTTSLSPITSSSVAQTTTPATSSSPTGISASQEGSSSTEPPASNPSTRRIFGNRNNRFQTRLNSVSRSTTTTTTTTPSPVSSTTRRPTTSTTRKSSRQLFAGRNRLSSPSSTVASTSMNNGNNTSSSSDSETSSPSSVARSRFSNNFTSRTRSTTASPEQPSSARPALFGGQRATFKPRLPFLKNTKPTTTNDVTNTPEATTTAMSTTSASESGSTRTAVNQAESLSTERPASSTSEISSDSNSEEATMMGGGPSEDNDMINEKEPTSSASSSSDSSGPKVTSTEAPATTSTVAPTTVAVSETGRNKPRVRPLFASRQRNTSLFGNRRSNNGTSTA